MGASSQFSVDFAVQKGEMKLEFSRVADTVLDCIADGVFTVDRDFRITYFNAAAEEIRKFEKRSGEILLTATARYEDEIAELKEHGVNEAFNLSNEAGAGYAHLVRKLLR